MSVEQTWWEMATEQWGIELARIPVVMVSALGIYLAFMLLVKAFGSRILTPMNATDTVVVIMFGAVAGRVIIGHPPSLAAGIVGLSTLMVLEAVFGTVRRNTHVYRLFDRAPILVLAHGEPIQELMDYAHVSDHDLQAVARSAGVGSTSDFAAIVLEPTGNFSTIRRGVQILPETFEDVKGAQKYLFSEAHE
ncbi:DUF421 domain-containing protein [Corynebacterium breve]|uniref:DUF421 domain-containing protein n=1 Tax=Corynebacterium breve TaxID=3049799 RepID=A0ABY8VL73_9CORY|nr:DUF421 domain-containing protein [Corynebacterium breve]WIM68944.1 DUF421 domain-containing protein [Corynebacterium breve]